MALSDLWQGQNAYIGADIEATPGTPDTPTVFPGVTKFTVTPKFQREQIPSLLSVGGFPVKRYVTVRTSAEASLDAPLTYENFGIFWLAGLGAVGSTTGTGPYTHPYTTGTGETLLPSLTLQGFPSGDIAEAVTASGAVCKSLKITGAKHSIVTIACEFMALSSTDFASGTARTAPSNETIVLGSHLAFTWGGTAHTDAVESAELMIENDIFPVDTIGSLAPRSIQHAHARKVSATVVLFCDDTYTRALVADRRAGTTRAAVLTFSDGTNSITATMAVCEIIEDIAPAPDGRGPLKVTLKLEPVAQVTPTAALTVTVVNGVSSSSGNG